MKKPYQIEAQRAVKQLEATGRPAIHRWSSGGAAEELRPCGGPCCEMNRSIYAGAEADSSIPDDAYPQANNWRMRYALQFGLSPPVCFWTGQRNTRGSSAGPPLLQLSFSIFCATARDLLASTGCAWWNGPSYGKAISRPPPAAWPRNTLRDGLSKRGSAPPNAKWFCVRSCR